jgi:hypothetical protein
MLPLVGRRLLGSERDLGRVSIEVRQNLRNFITKQAGDGINFLIADRRIVREVAVDLAGLVVGWRAAHVEIPAMSSRGRLWLRGERLGHDPGMAYAAGRFDPESSRE